MNHVHKDAKDLGSVIITVGKDISEGDNIFDDGVKTSDLVSRAHILTLLHRIMIFGPFEKKSMKGLFGVDIEPYFPLSLQKNLPTIILPWGLVL